MELCRHDVVVVVSVTQKDDDESGDEGEAGGEEKEEGEDDQEEDGGNGDYNDGGDEDQVDGSSQDAPASEPDQEEEQYLPEDETSIEIRPIPFQAAQRPTSMAIPRYSVHLLPIRLR